MDFVRCVEFYGPKPQQDAQRGMPGQAHGRRGQDSHTGASGQLANYRADLGSQAPWRRESVLDSPEAPVAGRQRATAGGRSRQPAVQEHS
ncbi:hypothetical protein ACIBHX_48200 [Nonomuraea sp. NPDC050536]|uniref:hypothetical protein n=1 Tax=Nonomuraea sp. NPDC050536 TaxID=3364366 RepID=UPI0037C7FA24